MRSKHDSLTNSGTSISRTLTGNENWFEKSEIRDVEG